MSKPEYPIPEHLKDRLATLHQQLRELPGRLAALTSLQPPEMDLGDCFIRPLGEREVTDAIQKALADRTAPKPKGGRMKRAVAEPKIAEHLSRRPHDTAEEVAKAVGCSVGVVAESKAWDLNQRRLNISKKAGIDPVAVKLDERVVSQAGGSAAAQRRRAREEEAHVHGAIDERASETYGRIGKYEAEHPEASIAEIAQAVGCTVREVKAQRALLNQLVGEQAEDQREHEPPVGGDQRQKWAPKRA